jgi:hypothetical protein
MLPRACPPPQTLVAPTLSVLMSAAPMQPRITVRVDDLARAQPAAEAFGRGCSGYFANPDGYAGKVAYNPHGSLADRGCVVVPNLP